MMDTDNCTLEDFQASIGFPLDGFQKQACQELIAGNSVLVCAPTGAGKTIVGQFAVFLALASLRKCFYTTPIKALSNQKYDELASAYGEINVGLLTGDNSINPYAPIIVMTTEVLRNMLYSKSSTIENLSFVVMDEVHFLADRFRGGVWEEIILGLPEHIKIVGLSATVSNAEEFGDWIQYARGSTAVIVEENRPVPLYQHMLIGNEIIPVYLDGKINPALYTAVAHMHELEHSQATNHTRKNFPSHTYRKNFPHNTSHKRYIRQENSRQKNKDRLPIDDQVHHILLDRPTIIKRLADEGFLPVIFFIFSRFGCDQAVNACLKSSLRLNSMSVREDIDKIIAKHTQNINAEDLEVIGFYTWREAIYRGFAAHHAGMLPEFRRAVEELFSRNFLKVIFATETLALGINMPAKSVFVEKLIKFNGENHVDISPGEFTQLTGRAGRRGIDTEGHAIICWRPEIEVHNVARLATTRTFPLYSSFTPLYNMSLKLLNSMGISRSIELISKSFAQFQADKQAEKQAKNHYVDLNKNQNGDIKKVYRYTQEILEKLPINCDEQVLEDYLDLADKLQHYERQLSKTQKNTAQTHVNEAIKKLRIHEVIKIDKGKHKGYAVIVAKKDTRLEVITSNGKKIILGNNLFVHPPQPLATLPKKLTKKNPHTSTIKSIISWLRSWEKNYSPSSDHSLASSRLQENTFPSKIQKAPVSSELANIKKCVRAHPLFPIMTDPAIIPFIAPLMRKRRLAVMETKHRTQIEQANLHSLTRIFMRIISILTELGYIADSDLTELTDKGQVLLHLYSESDLVIAQCLLNDEWSGLGVAELAAVISTMVFESRSDKKKRIHQLSEVPYSVIDAIARTQEMWKRVAELEIHYDLKPSREPNLGFVSATYAWSCGESLERCLYLAGERGQPQSAGDFVRWIRQIIDMLEQISTVSPDPAMSALAHKSAISLQHGIIIAGMTYDQGEIF